MWVGKALSFNRGRTSSSAVTPVSKKSLSLDINRSDNYTYEFVDAKRRRKAACFSFKEVSIEPETASTLKEVDSSKLKDEIRRWAKVVVAYAQQVSGKFSISRSNSSSGKHNSGDSFGDVTGG